MKKTQLALITALGLASSMVSADDFKLGYINVDRVFAEAKPAKAIQQALKDKYATQQTKLQDANKKIVEEQNQLQQLMGTKTSPEELSKDDQPKFKKLNTKFQKDYSGFQQNYANYQRAIQGSQELGLSILMSKTNAILKGISDKQGYDLVLTSNQLVYAKAKYDLTDQVMTELNKIDATDIIKQINNPTPMQGQVPVQHQAN